MLIEEIGKLFATIMVILMDIILVEASIIFGKIIYDDYIKEDKFEVHVVDYEPYKSHYDELWEKADKEKAKEIFGEKDD